MQDLTPDGGGLGALSLRTGAIGNTARGPAAPQRRCDVAPSPRTANRPASTSPGTDRVAGRKDERAVRRTASRGSPSSPGRPAAGRAEKTRIVAHAPDS